MVDSLACHVYAAPDRNLGIAVLTKNVSLNIADVHLAAAAQEITETCGIQRSSRSDYTLCRKPCFFLDQIGIYVYRIRHNDNQRILRIFHNVLCDIPGNACVDLCQIQTGLSFLTCNACGHDDNLRIRAFLVASLLDTYLAVEGCTMGNIKSGALRLFLIHIDQNDLAHLGAQHQRIADSLSYIAGADYNDFV